MNEIQVVMLCAFCFVAGVFAGFIARSILRNRGTAPGTGERISDAKGTASEAERTAEDIAGSVERSGGVIADIRKQKLGD